MIARRLMIALSFALLGFAVACAPQQPAKPAAAPAAAQPSEQAKQEELAKEQAAKEAAAKEEAAKEQAAKEQAAKEEATKEEAAKSSAVLSAAEAGAGVEFKVVYFDFDRYNIKPSEQSAISYDADQIKQHADMKVRIIGHCDERGTTEYNLALGEHRANAVKQALAAAGVDGARLSTISYGAENPVVAGHNETAWSKNRFGKPETAQN